MNLRGTYEGGGMLVTAKHWWHPRDRRDAKKAAKIIAHMNQCPARPDNGPHLPRFGMFTMTDPQGIITPHCAYCRQALGNENPQQGTSPSV